MADKKMKMCGMILKAKRLKEEKEAEEALEKSLGTAATEETATDEKQDENDLPNKTRYKPQRQDFCMVYMIRKASK